MRPTLPLAALLALTLLTSACTPETAATEDCPDAPCDWQVEESEADADLSDAEDVDVDADASPDSGDVADAEDPFADWQPSNPIPLPDDDVVIELVWEMVTPREEGLSTFEYHRSDLDLFYCVSPDGTSAVSPRRDCVSSRNLRLRDMELLWDSLEIRVEEYVVHDMLLSGRTHIAVYPTNPNHTVRAHARVHLGGEPVWERSIVVRPEDSLGVWYAGYIDWHEELADVTVSDAPACSDVRRANCLENDTLYQELTLVEE